MKVPVRIAPSRIHGLGIFAVEKIKSGEVLWGYQEPVDYEIRGGMCRASDEYMAHIERASFKPPGSDALVVCGDAGMFWNHSDTPNCIELADRLETVASRDIEPGEELTCDYRTLESRPMPFLEDAK